MQQLINKLGGSEREQQIELIQMLQSWTEQERTPVAGQGRRRTVEEQRKIVVVGEQRRSAVAGRQERRSRSKGPKRPGRIGGLMRQQLG
jgi:hypothetical protein